MKKIIITALLAFGTFIVTTEQTTAQVSVNINIGNQPAWGPVGYDYAQYYYIPEYNVYYDVMTNQYIYLNNRRWVHNRMLPHHLRHINLYRTHKVVLNQRNPYLQNNYHRKQYHHYRNDRSQMVLRDNRGYQQHRAPVQHQPRHNEPRRAYGNRPNNGNYRNDNYNRGRVNNHRNNDRIAQNQRSQQQYRNGDRRNDQRNRNNDYQRNNGNHNDRGPRR